MSGLNRVVVTGMGLTSPIGHTLPEVTAALREGRTGVREMPEWAVIEGLSTRVAAPVAPGVDESVIPRAARRTMGPQAVFASIAAQAAVRDAALDAAVIRGGRAGVAIGSTLGSPASLHEFLGHFVRTSSVVGLKGTAFLQCMGHTCAANVALLLGVTGRVLAPISACTSGSQALGAGYETVRAGLADVMICGGADEAHFTAAATFDVVRATSSAFNTTPAHTPRPFDAQRDGLVIGEGSGILVLESLDHARARGARIHAEVIGYATSSDGAHMSQPQQGGMEACMRLGLASAGITASDVDYINAHATATVLGDAIEAAAVRSVFGDRVPISSTKGHTGHTLGACGALETIFTILMMEERFIAPTRNLEDVDASCAGLRHVRATESHTIRTAMKNNFAFGGVNTSIILRAYDA